MKISNLLILLFISISVSGQISNLKLNLKPGDNYKQKINNSETTAMVYEGEEQKATTSTEYVIAYKVISKNDNGYNMEATYEKLSMTNHLPTGPMEFSSEINNQYDLLSTLFKGLTNKAFGFKLNSQGEIIEIDDLTPICDKIISGIDNLMDIQKTQFRQMLMGYFGHEVLKRNIEFTTAIYPKSTTKMGEKWVDKKSIQKGIISEIETNYRLKDTGPDYYVIKGDAILNTTRKDQTVDTDVKYKMTGTLLSEVKVNKQSGWVLEAQLNQELKGDFIMKGNSDLPKSMPMTMTKETVVTNID